MKKNKIKKVKVKVKIHGTYQVLEMTETKFIQCKETLEDLKAHLPRFIKFNPDERHRLCCRNRSILFDVTTSNFFKTGLMSENVKKFKDEEISEDHYYQRTKACEKIFLELVKNPEMDVETFISLLIKYCSTITLTKKEHRRVGDFTKKNKTYLNYQVYNKLGINVEGLSELIKKNFDT
jgi:hypothetical protein